MIQNERLILTDRFKHALCMAFDFHREQVRKNLPNPYMCHLMSVAALVIENIMLVKDSGGNAEDFVITALLHDAVEDEGGLESRDKIEAEFGPLIADYVMMLSDSAPKIGEKKPPKTERNRIYIEKIKRAPNGIALISCCDKIHNLRSMSADYLVLGSQIKSSYSLGPQETVDNYRRLGLLYEKKLAGHRILTLYQQAVDEVAQKFGTA